MKISYMISMVILQDGFLMLSLIQIWIVIKSIAFIQVEIVIPMTPKEALLSQALTHLLLGLAWESILEYPMLLQIQMQSMVQNILILQLPMTLVSRRSKWNILLMIPCKPIPLILFGLKQTLIGLWGQKIQITLMSTITL